MAGNDDGLTCPSDYLLQKMLVSPQAERNWESLSLMLEDVLENQSHRQLFALELGSGTGQHVIRFAQRMPFVTWQPTDIKDEFLDRFVSYSSFPRDIWFLSGCASWATASTFSSYANTTQKEVIRMTQIAGLHLHSCLQH